MTATLLFSLLIPILTGWLLVCLLLPYQERTGSYILIKLCLAIGLGFGISSISFFVSLLAFGQSATALILIEISLAISLLIIFLYKKDLITHPKYPEIDFKKTDTNSKIRLILSLGFYTALFSAVLSFIFLSLNNPHGGWDTWAVWNLRARFLLRGGDKWRQTFSSLIGWSPPDYPLLVPGSVARCWEYIGNETVIIPIILSFLFAFATAGLLFSVISASRGRNQGYLAGLILLATPFFIETGASQNSDVPLSFFFLATLVLFYLQDNTTNASYSLLSLSGLTAGLSAWTKNEGLLFLSVVVFSRFVISLPKKGGKNFLKELAYFAIGATPILAILLYFKTQIAPQNYLLASQGYKVTTERLTDLSRYLRIGNAFMKDMAHFGRWAVSITILLVFYLLLAGIRFEKKRKSAIKFCFVSLSLMLLGYAFVYLITPYDLQWHLDTSLNRLLLQLWPGFIFLYFMVVRGPEQAIKR
jgi:hypothetical protein